MAQPAKLFQDVYAQVATDLQRKLGADLASQAGPPASMPVTPVTDKKRIEGWNAAHPQATDAAMMQLAAQKLAEHRAAGLPEDQAIKATAEDLTHFRYRARQQLYTLGTTTWAEQVAEAKRLAKAAAKEAPVQAPTVEAGAAPLPAVGPAVPAPEAEMGGPLSSLDAGGGPEPRLGPDAGAVPTSPVAPPPGGLTSGY